MNAERVTYREVVLDSRRRLSLAKIPRKIPATRYRVTEHHDGSITLTPMQSVPVRAAVDGEPT